MTPTQFTQLLEGSYTIEAWLGSDGRLNVGSSHYDVAIQVIGQAEWAAIKADIAVQAGTFEDQESAEMEMEDELRDAAYDAAYGRGYARVVIEPAQRMVYVDLPRLARPDLTAKLIRHAKNLAIERQYGLFDDALNREILASPPL